MSLAIRLWSWMAMLVSFNLVTVARLYAGMDVGESRVEEALRGRPQAADVAEGEKALDGGRVAPPSCRCLDCDEDERCGGIWSGEDGYRRSTSADDGERRRIHVVVSHCKRRLDWVSDLLEGYDASVVVITKCGAPVLGAPEGARVLSLPNVGRCDHTYAHYIANLLNDEVGRGAGEEGDPAVVFLKDDMEDRNAVGRYYDFDEMVRMASARGFSCGMRLSALARRTFPRLRRLGIKMPDYMLSAYHDAEALSDFRIGEYATDRKGFGYDGDGVAFGSGYATLGAFGDALAGGAWPPSDLVQVCYGGIFAASLSSIRRVDASVWRNAEGMLSRGDNIQEGHYMERLWGALLSRPLEPDQADVLRQYSGGILRDDTFMGALFTTR